MISVHCYLDFSDMVICTWQLYTLLVAQLDDLCYLDFSDMVICLTTQITAIAPSTGKYILVGPMSLNFRYNPLKAERDQHSSQQR